MNRFRKIICSIVLCAFLADSTVSRASLMPGPALTIPMTALSAAFHPVNIQGLQFDPADPLKVDFIVDEGDHANADKAAFEAETAQLAKYFLAGLTVPRGELWVNLSPYEGERVIPEALGQTGLGKVFLEQDALLKNLTASLIHPDSDTGKRFWAEVTGRRMPGSARRMFRSTRSIKSGSFPRSRWFMRNPRRLPPLPAWVILLTPN